MKTLYVCLSLLLLAGCGKDEASAPKPVCVYPALNESPPPPPPPLPPASDTSSASGQSSGKTPEAVPSEITVNSEYLRETAKLDYVKRLREYAAKAAPGDPFAMTAEEIEAFSKLKNPVLN